MPNTLFLDLFTDKQWVKILRSKEATGNVTGCETALDSPVLFRDMDKTKYPRPLHSIRGPTGCAGAVTSSTFSGTRGSPGIRIVLTRKEGKE